MDVYYSNSVPIKNVSFQVLTNKLTKKMSVVSKEINGINKTDMFTDGQATRGGLLDPRLGTTDYNTYCATCGLMPGECHGHTGHTDLAEPVYHWGYLDIVKNILGCVCLRCSKILIYKNEDEINEIINTTKKGKNRFAEIRKLTSNVPYCARTDQNCGVPVPKIKKVPGINPLVAITNLQNVGTDEDGHSVTEKKKQIREIITPKMAEGILRAISDSDYRLMGFDPSRSRPEDFIIKNFLIPPIAIRPSVKMSISSTTNYEDMLTGKLVDIIKTNMKIRKELDKESSTGKEMKYFNENVQLLQMHIATYYNNENISLPKSEQKSGGRATKSISERIKGKTGRIRGNLMGKRTDFSARTVITSDPNLSLDELGVPIKIAMNITFPEVVTPYNIDEMTKLVKNGRYVYPGANYVIPGSTQDGKKYTIDLRYRRRGIKLIPGDIVERHIRDGDPVLFNRQPSLHKLSMMCHKVKVINDFKLSTFRINVSVTTPYNADFDGDEMNMFVPQSIQTQYELAHIVDVSKHIITPKSSTPIIKLKQDTVIGIYQMTENNVQIDWHDAMNIVSNCKNIDKKIITKENTTSHKLFSTIIPPLINVIDGSKLEINNGNLVKGVVNGSALNGKIINFSWDRYGSKITKDFIDNSQKLVINYLLQDGFTIGLGDAIIPVNESLEIRKVLKEKMLEVQHLITEIENYPELLDPETFEKQIYSLLSTTKGDIPKMVMSKLNTKNHFFTIIDSGAKGNSLNLAQIVGGLGQDILKFARIEKKVNNRTLVHFTQNDDTAEARGFIMNSYFDGLEPHEFYFHHMTGREGLIDTAIKSVTGDTELMIIEKNNVKHVKIGEWIDELIKLNKNKVQKDEKDAECREEIKIDNLDISIPTTDLDGKVSWGQITGITRHLPSKDMYEIITHGGRKVTVTDSHSLLIWNENKSQFERISPKEINIGSYVPVTSKLAKPSKLSNCIDLNYLFPKDKYVHGSEFIKAQILVTDMLKDKKRMPAGWWDQNNGSTFTLPYNKIQLFLRTLWRSNNEMIQENCIYPYGTNKNRSIIYNKFEFNHDNGLFLGLYIAEGNSDMPSGYVQITNSDDKILDFVKSWFNKHNIKWSIDCKINKIGGKSISIRGYSVLLAKILIDITGDGARNKFIHPQCISAPREFLKALVNGIISGDGTVTNNSIQIGSSSYRLIIDLNNCLNTLNIFGKITTTKLKSNNLGTVNIADINILSIRSQWAMNFKNEIKLICDYKQAKLNELKPTFEHRNFTEHNDVVLDKITEINKIDGSKYEHVYDLTVPSTLNFGLANGLHVVDTADTGYLQRKLIKGMEDVFVAYDGTIRSGNNIIIQMLYGNSHLDQTMQKLVKLHILSWGDSKIVDKCKFNDKEMSDLIKNLKYDTKKTQELKDMNNEIVDIMTQFRDDLRLIQQKAKLNNITLTEMYFQPANYSRIIDDAKNSKTTENTPLDPLYVISELDRLMDPKVCRLVCVKGSDEDLIKNYDQKKAKYLFQIASYEYLNPKRCIYEYKFNKEKFDRTINDIINSFNSSTVEPGEMVGVLSAQSLGEPLTNLCLKAFKLQIGFARYISNQVSLCMQLVF
jgi:DNA-directed RNA polymerase beta' subunit